MKKKNTLRLKNELPELLEAVCLHKDCPEWLALAIWDACAEQNLAVIFTADYWRSRLAEIEADK